MLERPVQARVKLAVPYVGYLLMALAVAAGCAMRCSSLPAILIALLDARGLWRDAGRMLEQERA